MYYTMMLKDHNTKTLISGDKVTRITLETLSPEDVDTLKMLADAVELRVTFERTQ